MSDLGEKIEDKIKEVEKELDLNGYWKKERLEIKGALRKAFRRHPAAKIALMKRRVELPGKRNKDGSISKRSQVFYRCEHCQELFKAQQVAVDHIEPVVPLHASTSELNFANWLLLIARGIFCKVENLQVLCNIPLKKLPKGFSSCHLKKTQEERFIRKRIEEIRRKNYKVFKEKVDNGIEKVIEYYRTQYRSIQSEKKNTSTK